MKKTIAIFIVCMGICFLFLSYFFFSQRSVFLALPFPPYPPILWTNNVPIVVGYGEMLQDEEVQYIDENFWKAHQERLYPRTDIFLFDVQTFQNKKNEPLIDSLLQDKKTVLFYGYRLDVLHILEGKEDKIPYYTVKSDKTLHHYLYGLGYSKTKELELPVTIMGNFAKSEMEKHISNYLLKFHRQELIME